MKKFLIALIIIFFFVSYYFYLRYEDYKFYKSEDYIYTSHVLHRSNENFFNNYLRYPENSEELLSFIHNTDYLQEEFMGYKFSDKFLDYGISKKYIEDSLIVLYSLSFNKKDDWPNLIYSLNTLTFFNFVFGKPDILIYGSFPPANICNKRETKVLINENNEKINNVLLEKKINFRLRKARIDYLPHQEGELKIVYLEFNNENGIIHLKVHCYNNFGYEFKNLLILSVEDIMIENKLKKIIFPLHIFN